MNRVDPGELLRELRATFGTVNRDVPWIDVPALVYAIIAWESRFDLDAATIEPDGSVSLGLAQVNQKRWKGELGTLPMPSTLREQIDYFRPIVDSMVRNIQVAADSVVKRIADGETAIKFNPAFDGPLWGSIDWQYGGAPLKSWAATPGAEMGEIGFRAFREAQGKPVRADFERRTAAIRAAYSTAMDRATVGGGLIAMAQRTGEDWVSGAAEGFRRLAELTGVPSAVREAEAIGQHVEQYAADMGAALQRAGSKFQHAVERAVEIEAAATLGFLIVAGLALAAYLSRNQRRRSAAA